MVSRAARGLLTALLSLNETFLLVDAQLHLGIRRVAALVAKLHRRPVVISTSLDRGTQAPYSAPEIQVGASSRPTTGAAAVCASGCVFVCVCVMFERGRGSERVKEREREVENARWRQREGE